MSSFFTSFFTFLILVCAALWGGTPEAEALTIKAKAAVLMETKTGRVLFAEHKNKELPPASLTKIMTLLLIMEAVDRGDLKLTDQIKTSAEAAGMGGSQVFLREGEVLTAGEIIKSIVMVSANDASAAVAEHLAGSIEAFVSQMNKRAQELGMKNTNFENETGLPAENHYTSAYDIAIMARELLRHEQILEWSSTWLDSLRSGDFMLRNTNELIRDPVGVDGLKTGFTHDAGFCLVATAARKGMRLISVLLGAENNEQRLQESRKLLEYGFENFSLVLVEKKNEPVGTARVEKGQNTKVQAYLQADYWMLVEKGKEKALRTALVQQKLEAPLPAGTKVGNLQVFLDGRLIGEKEVITKEEVPRANVFVLIWRRIRIFLRNLFGMRLCHPLKKFII